LRQLLTGKVEKEILVVIGASNTGKSTMLEKVFKNALTVSDGVETAKYYVMSRAGKFATSGSHLANLTIVDDTTDTLGGKWLTEFIKTITDETRIVEYKGINAVECETPMGAIFNLNGAFYIKKMSEIACMNRFMIIDFTKIYNADRSFKDSLVIDRDTLISMALAQETYVEPIHNKEYKKKWLNWLDFWRGTGEHLIPSVE
jgi:phage/plasmid-associated DNA primase